MFWAAAESDHPGLSKLAMRLLNIPASSAQIKRVFSNWGQIHSPLRNRLEFERSKKLIHCYFSLNSKQRELLQLDDDDD